MPSGINMAINAEKENKIRVSPISLGVKNKGCITIALIKPMIIPT